MLTTCCQHSSQLAWLKTGGYAYILCFPMRPGRRTTIVDVYAGFQPPSHLFCVPLQHWKVSGGLWMLTTSLLLLHSPMLHSCWTFRLNNLCTVFSGCCCRYVVTANGTGSCKGHLHASTMQAPYVCTADMLGIAAVIV